MQKGAFGRLKTIFWIECESYLRISPKSETSSPAPDRPHLERAHDKLNRVPKNRLAHVIISKKGRGNRLSMRRSISGLSQPKHRRQFSVADLFVDHTACVKDTFQSRNVKNLRSGRCKLRDFFFFFSNHNTEGVATEKAKPPWGIFLGLF